MKCLALFFVALLWAPALGDIVYLNDGTKLEGDIQRTRDGWVITDAGGKSVSVNDSQVKSMRKTSGAEDPEQMLASLKRAMAQQSDPKQVIERFRRFIEQYPNTPASKEGEKEIATWQDRLDRGLIRVGDQWVTKEQQSELQARAQDAAEEIHPLLAAGKLADASAALDKALAAAPGSPSLLYLKGILLFRQQQLVPSRKAFEAVAAQLADHGPTHNDLAVILWKTHAQMPGLAEYDKAMLTAPENRTILDNVAEALNALPVEYRKNSLTKKVVEHFNEQDAGLAKKMAENGLYRWGSQWLDEKQYAKLQTAEKEFDAKKDAMQKDYDGVQARLIQIERAIVDEQNLANGILQESVAYDPTTGRPIRYPLPERYYDLIKDIQAMQRERVLKRQQLEMLKKQAAELLKSKPAPKYSGIQRIIDLEGMPGGGSTAPGSTQPAPSAAAPAQLPEPARNSPGAPPGSFPRPRQR